MRRNRQPGPTQRATGALTAVVVATILVFGIAAPPEHCPDVTSAQLRTAATEAVAWFTRNQEANGTWLYEYDAEHDEIIDDYNIVRHAGVTMGLYLAASAGIPGALGSADRGLTWALDRLLERDGWAALHTSGPASTGATALLVAGLAERRTLTGDDRHDDVMRLLGRFLVTQTEPSGAHLAYYDLDERAPVAGSYSKYYTGEAYWALARLHRLFPDDVDRWGEVANRIGGYLATDRDENEGYWPPIADHWSAYGLAETVEFDDRSASGGDRPLSAAEAAFARRQAELFGAQVRWVSQRFGPWGILVRSPHVPRGGGYGVVGEALTGFWRVARADVRLADLEASIGERAICIAALSIEAQSTEAEAQRYDEPDRVEGAWIRDGGTRMDDQQHALAALLRTEAIVEARAGGDGAPGPGGGKPGSKPASEEPAPSWLWFLAALAAVNPLRLALSLPTASRSHREQSIVAVTGGASGALIALVAGAAVALLGGTIDVSTPALRLGTAIAAGVAALAALVHTAPEAEPALPGRRAALVPVAVPLVANVATVFVAAGTIADHGVVVASVFGAATVLATAAVTPATARTEGPSRRVVRWGSHLMTGVLAVVATLLVVDGVFAV